MHKILLSVVAAGALFAVVPASAQDIGVSIGERGVRVGVDNDHGRDARRERRIYTDGRARHRDCAEVTVRKRMPDGTVVIRKSQRC